MYPIIKIIPDQPIVEGKYQNLHLKNVNIPIAESYNEGEKSHKSHKLYKILDLLLLKHRTLLRKINLILIIGLTSLMKNGPN